MAAAQHLVATAAWANAYFVDLEGVVTGTECCFQLMAAFGIPADTSDLSALVAWLTRMTSFPMGLVVHCPPDIPPRLHKHIGHNVDKMLKVGCNGTTAASRVMRQPSTLHRAACSSSKCLRGPCNGRVSQRVPACQPAVLLYPVICLHSCTWHQGAALHDYVSGSSWCSHTSSS